MIRKKRLHLRFLYSLQVAPPMELHHIECFDECGQGETSRCFTCNPDLDGDDFEKLVELGSGRDEQNQRSVHDEI